MLKKIIKDEQPEIVGLVEGMLDTGDGIAFSESTVVANDRTSDGNGSPGGYTSLPQRTHCLEMQGKQRR